MWKSWSRQAWHSGEYVCMFPDHYSGLCTVHDQCLACWAPGRGTCWWYRSVWPPQYCYWLLYWLVGTASHHLETMGAGSAWYLKWIPQHWHLHQLELFVEMRSLQQGHHLKQEFCCISHLIACHNHNLVNRSWILMLMVISTLANLPISLLQDDGQCPHFPCPPICCPLLSVRVEHQGIPSSASTRMQPLYTLSL